MNEVSFFIECRMIYWDLLECCIYKVNICSLFANYILVNSFVYMWKQNIELVLTSKHLVQIIFVVHVIFAHRLHILRLCTSYYLPKFNY